MENDNNDNINNENIYIENSSNINEKNERNSLLLENDLKSSLNSLQNHYKYGFFESVINGPRGPDVRLHRYHIIVGFLKLFLLIFITAGIVLLTVIMLCITINVGYVCVQIDNVNSYIQLIFFSFYFNALYSIIRSLWRTYLRLIHTILNLNLGASIHDIFIKRVLGRYISKYIASWTLPSNYVNDKTLSMEWYEKINMLIFCIFLIIILLPIPCIALFYGYWSVVGTLCLLFVGGGAITIVGLNIFSRFLLFLKFFRRLDELYYNAPSSFNRKDRINNQTYYLRLIYCTTNKYTGNTKSLNYVLIKLIWILIDITLAAFVFGSFDPEVAKDSVVLEIITILIPLKYRKPIYQKLYHFFVKLNIIEECDNMKEIENNSKNKINAEIIETHQNYMTLKRNSVKGIYRDLSFIDFNKHNNSDHNHNFNYSDTFLHIAPSNSKITPNNHLHCKVLTTWNIKSLISWKPCLTVFFTRCVKFFIGIGFMAVLHYYRYSTDSDNETTNNNLLIDLTTHIFFIVLLLCQDILFVIPAKFLNISMKTRKYIFIILLCIELGFVIVTRIYITNNYIPMAFIIIAYANFIVHPDPRYTWDDEKKERLTLFDLFKPEINIKSKDSENNNENDQSQSQSQSQSQLQSQSQPLSQSLSQSQSQFQPLSQPPSQSQTKGQSQVKTQTQTQTQVRSQTTKPSRFENINNSYRSNYYNISVRSQSKIQNINYNNENTSQESSKKNIINNSRYAGNVLNSKIIKDNENKIKLYNLIQNVREEIQYKRHKRARYNSGLILIITALMIIISIVIGIMLADDSKLYLNQENNNKGLFSKQKPTICQWTGNGISISEFSALAYACYYDTIEDINYSWLYGKPKTSTNEFIIGDNSINSKSGVHYVDFINEEKKIIVVAIRGTQTIEDAFQDVYIWSASALLQLSGFFGTFIKFWPRDTIALLVKIIVKQFTNSKLLYWKDVEKHVKYLQDNKNYTLYLTGHSLGGGVAGVISGHLNIPAITFSSPGLGYSYKTYDIELDNLINNYVNIVPMSDPVPLLDSQIGQIQHIQCYTGEPLSCHRVFNTMDTLNKMCGDVSVYRYWDSNVDKNFNGEPAHVFSFLK
ncbi:hypothetical protein BCR32DRAFT_273619 [Anaeromyces robustus]|uniref:Fungal lipase-type domain-containing protein n=1 Tax=Anaeromyces robustus TaxID=1754192 RepID=A0A1Y1V7E0_9FUNG|nr:hypothetical protein BCR32DRAFT_273619 [Anaeromyces robustus]|eukprot:ORX48194.1 hypothetical protein BCR32DRAFT_273619 [Anaeromyces robustus]